MKICTVRFFRGGRPFFKTINIFAFTCANRSGVGAIDNPDRFEQAFDTYYLTEVSEKIFTDGILMDHLQKMSLEKNVKLVWKNEGHTSSA